MWQDTPWLALLVAFAVVILSYVVRKRKKNLPQRFGAQQVEEVCQEETKELAFTKKMRKKSMRIVDEAENGELKQTVEKCKRFLSSFEASNFACKIFVNSWEDIEGVKNFEKIVENEGEQLELPEKTIEGIKLSALAGKGKKDYLAFECAIKNGGKVRLHTGGYQVIKNKTEAGEERIDFQIALNYIDMKDITLKKLPEGAVKNLEKKWFQSSPSVEYQAPEEGEDWNAYFQYKAHKNILKELH